MILASVGTSSAAALETHLQRLRCCRRCPRMTGPVVHGSPVLSRVMLVGQAPGDKEPILQRPFAWTAGRTLFRWFEEASGVNEFVFRSKIYIAAVCRCFPGKKPEGGDRVPGNDEIGNCAPWLDSELDLLRPELVIPVGTLAIGRFLAAASLEQVVGKQFRVQCRARQFDLVALPHPSGASTWPRREPGKALLQKALQLIAVHPAWRSATNVESGANAALAKSQGGVALRIKRSPESSFVPIGKTQKSVIF